MVAFDEAAEGEAGASSPAFVAYAVHAFSLLHATALHSLRGDSMEGALVSAPLHPRAQVGWFIPRHNLAGYTPRRLHARAAPTTGASAAQRLPQRCRRRVRSTVKRSP